MPDVTDRPTSRPVLRTARLDLVPLTDAHLDLEVALDGDPHVMRFLTGRAQTRAEVQERHTRRMRVGAAGTGLGYWVGFTGDDFVGWWALMPPERPEAAEPAGQAELGYRLGRRFWRQGLATEGAAELLRHAFETLLVPRVFAETMTVNTGSRAVLRAVGLRPVRTFHEASPEPLPGAEDGVVEYALTRDDWSGTARWR